MVGTLQTFFQLLQVFPIFLMKLDTKDIFRDVAIGIDKTKPIRFLFSVDLIKVIAVYGK